MADKQISDLTAASSVEVADLLVLEQNGTAKKLTGQILINWMTSYADGHGGIHSITWTTSGTSGNGQYHNATIHYADETTSTFSVRDGVKGDTGDAWQVYIKYSAARPTSDSEIGDLPDNWMGIYAGTTAPTSYTDYAWFEIKGEKGDTGDSIAQIRKTGSAGLTDTYSVTTEDGVNVGTFTVTNGSGGVSTVDDISPDSEGDVKITNSTVADLGLTVGSATIAAAYAALHAKAMLFCPATDFANAQLPYIASTYMTDGVIEMRKGANASEGYIAFHGRSLSAGSFSMGVNSSGVPTGTWTQNMQLVSSVAELGLTVGSATVAETYAALPPNTTLYANNSNFADGQLPSTYGMVEMHKGNNDGTRGWVEFHGRDNGTGDYKAAINSSGVVSTDANGVPYWRRQLTGYDIVTDDFTTDNVTINANSNYTWTRSIAKTGCTPIFVTVETSNATTSGGNSSWCNCFGTSINGNTLTASVRNFYSSAAVVKLIAKVIYLRD